LPVIAFDNRLRELVAPDSPVEEIGSGFAFTEGPVWHPRERYLAFSDIPNSTLHRWSDDGGLGVLRRPSGQTNGNTLDPDGNLLSCEHEGRRISRMTGPDTVETVVDRFDGKRLNSPNDLICLPNGDIIFTDPPYGLRLPDGSFGPQEIPFSGVYRYRAADAALLLLADDFERPNGVAVSNDGKRVFVDDTARHVVRAFDIRPDGSVANRRDFAQVRYRGLTGRPDGMKLDVEGNLYVAANTSEEGIWVFSAEGEHLGFIVVGGPPSNLAWGDDDRRTLYVTAGTQVFRLRTQVAGQPLLLF
jgi:gluconolactonase